METDTFGGLPTVLAEYGLADRAYELNRAAARIAREVAAGYGGWVAGSMGPGTKLPSLGQIRFADLRDGYEIQARGLLDGGVDLLLVETVYDLLQAKAALVGCRRAMAAVGRDVPIQLQVTMETNGRMLLGTEIGAALTALEAMGPDVFGLNCATGPREMNEHLRHLSQHSRLPISCLPNAGLPSVVDGRTHYDLTPDELADFQTRFITDLGVSVVGGCCGTTPEHLSRVVERCRDLGRGDGDYVALPADQSRPAWRVGPGDDSGDAGASAAAQRAGPGAGKVHGELRGECEDGGRRVRQVEQPTGGIEPAGDLEVGLHLEVGLWEDARSREGGVVPAPTGASASD